jgi:hypothetical protein
VFPNLITTVAATDATVATFAASDCGPCPARALYTKAGAGVEGTMHQAASHGARRARYRGLPKTRLDHLYMACALNLLRLGAYWTGTPLDRQRTSHLARLEHVEIIFGRRVRMDTPGTFRTAIDRPVIVLDD